MYYIFDPADKDSREFTPELVKFHNNYFKKNKRFHVVMLSFDDSKDEMMESMREYKMPWPAIKFNKKASFMRKYAKGPYIPNLTLVNRRGKVIESSFVKGKMRDPGYVLRKLMSKL